MANTGLGKMHLDLYTQNAGLTHKAKFWCNYVSALKGKNVFTNSNLVFIAMLDFDLLHLYTLFFALFYLTGITFTYPEMVLKLCYGT